MDAVEEYVVDRFEGEVAVLEDRITGKMKNVQKGKLPDDSKEGDIIKYINGKYFVDRNETEKVEKEIQYKYNNLWE